MTRQQRQLRDLRILDAETRDAAERREIDALCAKAGGMDLRSVAVAPQSAYSSHAKAAARRNAERKAGNSGAGIQFDASLYESATMQLYLATRTVNYGF